MKSKELTIVNLVLAVLVLLFAGLTFKLSINGSLTAALQASVSRDNSALLQAEADTTQGCSSQLAPAISNETSSDPHISKLLQYQQVCGSFVTDQLMIFARFPATPDDAQIAASQVAAKLKIFETAKIRPLVIVEPYAGDTAMSYKEYLAGKYDAAVDSYFQRLKASGISDKAMGTWVPFPESNTPAWNNKDTEPRDFALGVNRYLSALRKQFPTTSTSILLNATTYEPTDLEYNNGDYLSLIPYLQDINKDLIDSLGIQGFPFVSRASQERREIFKAEEFLQPDLAVDAAKELRTRDIWFNTGSFAAKYTNSAENRVAISPTERKAILSGILETAKSLQTYQQNEYRVSINLFSEDKSYATEATDWSYFQTPDHEAIFKDFMRKPQDQEIPVSLYDKTR
jgi:hypothetical protein